MPPTQYILLSDFTPQFQPEFQAPIYGPPGKCISGLKFCKPNLTLWELNSIFGSDFAITIEDTKTGLMHDSTLDSLLQDWAIEPGQREGHLFCKINILDTPMEPCYEPPDIIDLLAGGLYADIKDERLFYCIQKHVRFELRSDLNCTWMFILSGEFKVTMYAPTEHNKMMHLLSSTGEFNKKDISNDKDLEFYPEPDTELIVPLKATAFLAIPTGWMYTFEALDDGYIFGGQFLDKNNMDWQFSWLARKLAIDTINGEEENLDHIKLLLKRLASRQVRAGREKILRDKNCSKGNCSSNSSYYAI